MDSKASANWIDREFRILMDYLGARSLDQVRQAVEKNLKDFERKDKRNYDATVDYYNLYRMWGVYQPERGDFSLIENRAQALWEHKLDFEWLYGRLCDCRSKKVLLHILSYWLSSDHVYIATLQDKYFHQYFDYDLIPEVNNEVVVDLGAYVGDTMIDFVKMYGAHAFRTYYCYEIVPQSAFYIEKNIERYGLKNVLVCLKGAASASGSMCVSAVTLPSTSKLTQDGGDEVPVVAIDEDIEEPVTWIKMDVEGGEQQALLGCQGKIRQSHPKLTLSAYHSHEDLWKLARMVDEIDPSYRFYLRYYGHALLPTEYVLYGL